MSFFTFGICNTSQMHFWPYLDLKLATIQLFEAKEPKALKEPLTFNI
jgi:hypothetical protein